MRLGVVLAVLATVACSSSDRRVVGIGSATIETDLPVAPALMTGSASAVNDGNVLTITVNDVVATRDACEPAAFTSGANVAGLFELKIVVNAVSPSGDIVPGTYEGAAATYRELGGDCSTVSTGNEMQATVEVDVKSGTVVGGARATFTTDSSRATIVTVFQAPQCAARSSVSSDAGQCLLLPFCDAGATICM